MQIIVRDKLYIIDYPQSLLDWCNKYLVFPNPDYIKKQERGFWTGNVEREIVMYARMGDTIILPYGCLEYFQKCNVVDETFHKQPYHIEYNSNIDLFDYQQRAFDTAMKKCHGVIVMPCGSGKTQTALAIASRLGLRTLWLTHTHELLKQSLDRAKSCFDMPKEYYGTITQGKIDIGQAITFATVQTMSKIDLRPYTDYFDCVIVDECHKAIGTPSKMQMFYKVVSQLNAKYKFGLTATPERADGLHRTMFALLGNIIHTVTDEEVANNVVPVKVFVHKSSAFKITNEILNTDGTINYTGLINSLCLCEERNIEIAKLVNYLNSYGKTVLVLSDRVEHLSMIRQKVGLNYTAQINGATKSAERDKALQGLKSRQLRCLFATYGLVKEGQDIPSLDALILATPHNDKISVVQSLGRVARKYPGKEYGIAIDIVEQNHDIFFALYNNRKKYYREKKYIVKNFQ